MTADLRAAIEAALPGLTEDQADAATALLDALAPMDEPQWPGAPIMAGCGSDRERLHVRRNDGPNSGWECAYSCHETEWERLDNPRPLTPDEYAKYGIPSECEQPHAEPITDELVERCIEASTFMYPAWVRAVLRAAGHPEADR